MYSINVHFMAVQIGDREKNCTVVLISDMQSPCGLASFESTYAGDFEHACKMSAVFLILDWG